MTETKELPWNHELDARKYILKIHDNNIKRYLTEDFKNARFGPKEKELILTMLTGAQQGHELCPNKAIAREIVYMDMLPLRGLSILNFNQGGNPAIQAFGPGETEKEEEEDMPLVKELLGKISGKRKPKAIEEDE